MDDLKILEDKRKALFKARNGAEKSERTALDKETRKVSYKISQMATEFLKRNGA
jgi:hypothetical protein